MANRREVLLRRPEPLEEQPLKLVVVGWRVTAAELRDQMRDDHPIFDLRGVSHDDI
jgi:hypothetical protein